MILPAHVTLLPGSQTHMPVDRAELADLVRQAAEAGTPVYPLGGGTHWGYGAPAARAGLGLSTGRLDRLIDYPARDLTITVGAGMRVATLAQHLASQGQCLPVDVPYADQATVGGMVATGAFGLRSHPAHHIRDFVLGLQAVDGRGTLFSAGGRVVKNAAGYNLCRLLIGSLGSLGVIVQVTLMVRPRPETAVLAAWTFAQWAAAEDALQRLHQSGVHPAGVLLLAGPAWQRLPGLEAEAAPALGRLVALCEGMAGEVAWMLDRLKQAWSGAGLQLEGIARDAAAWPAWHTFVEFRQPADLDEHTVIIEAHVLPSAVVTAMLRICELDPQASVVAQAHEGCLLARVAPAVVEPLRGVIHAAEGTLIVAQQSEKANLDRRAVWGPPPPGFAVMQALKDRFDPRNILNPGRFIFP